MLLAGKLQSRFPEPQSTARGSAFRQHYYNIDRTVHYLFYAKFIKKMRTGVRIFINNHMKDLLPSAAALYLYKPSDAGDGAHVGKIGYLDAAPGSGCMNDLIVSDIDAHVAVEADQVAGLGI